MCGNTLTLGRRDIFLKGLDDVIAKPVLSMEHEFARDHKWVDWKGVEYTLRKEWAYVTGVAKTTLGCTPGTRDADNNGKTPDKFKDDVNAFIAERREAGHGTLLLEEHALLTMDEVLAIRLYSGPAYQPINNFLRQMMGITDDTFRREVAQHPLLSFASTVGHICRAIRKLSAVATPDESYKPLWRCVGVWSFLMFPLPCY